MTTAAPRTTHTASLLAVAAVLARGQSASAQYEQMDACIQASETALVLNKAGKLLDERTALSACAAASCPDAVKASCRERLAAVIRAIPTIVFAVKDEGGRDLSSVKLTIDGSPYVESLDGGAIKLDPGPHEFRFDVDGEEPAIARFVLHESEQDRHETIVVGAGPVPPPPSASGGAPQRTIALSVTGVGVAALLAGGITAGLSLAAHDSYENYCGSNIGAPPGRCSTLAIPGEKDAATKGSVATGLLLGGGALAAAGVVWFFLAPRARSSIQLGFGFDGIRMKGEF